MHTTASFTRLLPLHRQRVRQPRVLAKPYTLKGNAEVPTDKELVLLEIEARRKVHADRQRLQPLHNQLVAEMREQLDKEWLMLGSIDPFPFDAAMLPARDSSEQEAQGQSVLTDAILHEAAAINDLGPIWFPQQWNWPMNALVGAVDLVETHPLLLQAPAVNQIPDYTNHEFNNINRNGVISVVGVTHGIETVSFSNFEELFDAFPHPSFH
ncbi:hypothetical protein BJ741DRAFT_650793 [Chytriomyces cf. hyalinus JEL632]|nr:hypothetical protein BJ741DRAFT_650793 [Chytriomyces cf. hyalinus JEL632]